MILLSCFMITYSSHICILQCSGFTMERQQWLLYHDITIVVLWYLFYLLWYSYDITIGGYTVESHRVDIRLINHMEKRASFFEGVFFQYVFPPFYSFKMYDLFLLQFVGIKYTFESQSSVCSWKTDRIKENNLQLFCAL